MNPSFLSLSTPRTQQVDKENKKLSLHSHKPSKALQETVREHNLWRKDFFEKRDDNILRKEKVTELLEEFLTCSTEEVPNPNLPRAKPTPRPIQIAQKMLGYYNIQMEFFTYQVADSAVRIVPITDFEHLIFVIRDLIPRILAFPYSLLKQLGMTTITFCEDISLVHPKHASVYNQKLLSGIFPLYKLATSEDILQHLCRVMMHQLTKNVPNFTSSWREFSSKFSQNLSTLDDKQEHQELAKVFQALIENKGDNVDLIDWEMKNKMEELVHQLYEVDPVGVKSDWVVVKALKHDKNKENLVFVTLDSNKEGQGQKKQ